MSESPQQDDHREHFFGAAKVVAILTLLSRVLGLVRDMAIWAFGATARMDVFWTAFSVPNMFRRLFGEGALSAAFVPVFTDASEAEGWDKARQVLANVAGWLSLVLVVLLVVGELILGLWLVLAPGGADRQLMLQLLQIVLPFMVTICLLALGSAALNCKGHFAFPAMAPMILNVFLIVAAVIVHRTDLGSSREGLFVLSGSIIVAGVVQLVGVVWLLKSFKLLSFPRLRPMLPETVRVAKLMLPMMVPLSLLQFSALFDRFYAWTMTATADSSTFELFGWTIQRPLQEGVVTCLYAANRLYQFPLGVLAISLATVVFPLFSRYAAAGDTDALRTTTNRALRLALFLGIPAGAALWALATPAAEAICRHGEFSDEAATRVADILQMYCLGMGAYFCNHILLRAFFSMKDTRTPLKIAMVLVALNVALVIALIAVMQNGRAVGLATAVTASLNTLLLVAVLRRRFGHLGLASIGKSVLRTLVASAAMFAAARYVGQPIGEPFGSIGELLAAMIVGASVFLAAAGVMRSTELGELLRRRTKMRAERD